jgi:hypothetical protein
MGPIDSAKPERTCTVIDKVVDKALFYWVWACVAVFFLDFAMLFLYGINTLMPLNLLQIGVPLPFMVRVLVLSIAGILAGAVAMAVKVAVDTWAQ